MASVFSGVIPTVTVSSNSQINSLTNGLLNNLAVSAVSVALSDTLSQNLYNSLGLLGDPNSNFLGSVVTPGLISTGVVALNQTIATSLTNSEALGPLGPLAGGIVTAGVAELEKLAVGALFGQSQGGANNQGSKFFPGAGGQGEETANYLAGATTNGTGGKQIAYNSGPNGKDIVFTISSALTPAKTEATAQGAGAAGTPTGTAPATTGAAPAGTPSPGAPTPPATAQNSNNSNSPGETSAGWTFICPPEDISWETSAQAERIAIFGANQAPVIGGVRGMRDLNLNGAIVEGFCRGKSIEKKVISLEELLKLSMSADKRYVQVPVYKITASSKVYGLGEKDKGYFVIKSIKVQEKIRDLSGNATRAVVDISLTQVPSYQVEDGRDIAYQAIAGQQGPFEGIRQQVERPAQQAAAESLRLATTGTTTPAGTPPKTSGAAATAGGGATPAATPAATPTPPPPPPVPAQPPATNQANQGVSGLVVLPNGLVSGFGTPYQRVYSDVEMNIGGPSPINSVAPLW